MSVWILGVAGVAAMAVIGVLASAVRDSSDAHDDVKQIADEIEIITDD
jgi:hypothetical protein